MEKVDKYLAESTLNFPGEKMPEIVIFTHVPKVAGTSIVDRLIKENYSPTEIKTYRGERDLWRSRGNYRVLIGHSTYGVQYLAGQPAQMFTMLRDPIDRAVSHYYFLKQPFKYKDLRFGGNLEQHNVHNETPLSEIFSRNANRKYRLAGTWLVDNMQTRYLAGYAHYWKPANSSSLLSAAKRNLEKNYAEFGIQSRFEESVERIADRFGWRMGKPMEPTKQTTMVKALNDGDIEMVMKNNLLDLELFNFAEELFRKRGLR